MKNSTDTVMMRYLILALNSFLKKLRKKISVIFTSITDEFPLSPLVVMVILPIRPQNNTGGKKHEKR